MLFGKHVNKFYIKYGIYFLLGIAALILVDYFQLEIPEIIGDVVDGIHYETLMKSDLKEYIIKFTYIGGIMLAGRFLWRVCIFGNGIRIESDLRNELFFSMQKQSQEFFQENKTGALMTLYTNDLNMIRRVFGQGTLMLVDTIFLGGMTLYKMWILSPLLSVFSLIGLIIVMLVSSILGKKVKKAADDDFEAFSRLSDYVQEDISGIGVVKAFVKEQLQMRRFLKHNQEKVDKGMQLVKLDAKLDAFFDTVLSIMFTIIIAAGGSIIYFNAKNGTESFTVGQLTTFIAYFDTLIWPILSIGRLIRLRSQGKASLDRVTKIIDHEVEINDDLANYAIEYLNGDIEFNNLTFKYPGAQIDSLHDVSFNIKKGEFVGVIGGTGSGKSTLVELLLRLYNIQENSILIDGNDIMTIPLKTVRNNIAYVPQDNFLFSKTIRENIAFSSDFIIDEDIEKYAKISDVYDDISEFEKGFDTVLGERGVTVSGGQKQRIAIARALYKDASILILDDSLSAVDTETEKNIINHLRELRAGKTTIIIAHRITTLQNLDKILVVEDGTVTGVGTHDELLKTSVAYATEVKYQELEREAGVGQNGKRR